MKIIRQKERENLLKPSQSTYVYHMTKTRYKIVSPPFAIGNVKISIIITLHHQ